MMRTARRARKSRVVDPSKAIKRRSFLQLVAATAASPTFARPAGAQGQIFPARPITMIVPFAAGGGTDLIGRVLAERMRGLLGQPVIVENVTGAAGNIGVGRVARAAPDGYTILMGIWNTQVANGALYSLQYDLVGDFQPIALISDTPMLLVARKGLPASDLRSLIAWLKANPGASVGTAGVGSAEHLVALFLQNTLKARFEFIPYRGSGPAIQDLVGGQFDVMVAPSVPSLPHIRSGNLKAYAVTSSKRLPAASEIPSVDEAGLPGFYFSLWTSLWTTKGTPKEVVSKLNAAVVDALADPEVRARLGGRGPVIVPREGQTPEALADLQKAEIEKWWPIIRAASVKGE